MKELTPRVWLQKIQIKEEIDIPPINKIESNRSKSSGIKGF